MMATFPKTSAKFYILTVTILPLKEGVDLPRFIQKVHASINDYASATRIIYKFKVSGESKLLAVLQASNIIGLERTIAGLWRLGSVNVECTPIVSYETFARSIKVGDHLTKPNTGCLSKEGLYWLEFDVGYDGKTTDELIGIWRREAEAVLTARHKEGTSIELYKVVAQRKVHAFINASDPEQVDLLSFQLPIMLENGANVKIHCKALQFLEDYCTRIIQEAIPLYIN